MIRVIDRVTYQHDYRVVPLAAPVCAIAYGTAAQMLVRAAASAEVTRKAWLAIAAPGA